MLTDLAEDLAKSDWQVSVITSDALHRKSRPRLASREVRNGVDVARVWMPRLARYGLAGRAVDSLFYAAGATLRLFRGRWDVAGILTDPPLLVVPASAAARRRGMRIVYWLHDIFPQIAAEHGVLQRESFLYRGLLTLARRAAARVDMFVALGDLQARRATEIGAAQDRTVIIHNWADTRHITPKPRDFMALPMVSVSEDDFVLLYSGNIGRAHTFTAILEAARELREERNVKFLFVGSGPRLPELKEASDSVLPNVLFAPSVPREQLSATLSLASASLVTEISGMAGLVVPSKTYGILASGRPILFVGSPDSDVAGIVRRHDCGAVHSSSDATGIVATLRRWRSNPIEVERLGANARAAALVYDRQVATSHWDAVLSALLTTH
jgi:colanic acid biosynthesis glycosyl transferase WcaI